MFADVYFHQYSLQEIIFANDGRKRRFPDVLFFKSNLVTTEVALPVDATTWLLIKQRRIQGAPGTLPSGSNFLRFYAVFKENWTKYSTVASTFEVGAHTVWGILNPPLSTVLHVRLYRIIRSNGGPLFFSCFISWRTYHKTAR